MMDLLENAATALEVTLNCLAVGIAAGWRRTDWYRIGAVALAVLGLTMIITYCNHLQSFSLFTFIPPLFVNVFLLSFLYTKGSFILRFAGHTLCITYILIVDYIVCVMFGLVFGWNENTFSMIVQPGVYRSIYLVVNKGADILLFFVFRRLLQKVTRFQCRYQYMIAGAGAVALVLVQLSFANFLSLNIDSMMLSFVLLWMLMLLTLFCVLGMFIVLFSWTQQKQMFQQLQTVNQAVLADYQHMQDQYRRQAGMQHDITNQLLTLRNSKALGDSMAAKAYIDQLLQRHCSDTALYDTGCEIINAILNFKAPEAKKGGIAFVVNAQFTEDTGIAPVDICTVLTNQVDNAIEACRRLPPSFPRRVDVKIYIQGHMAFFVVENTMDHDPHINNENLETTKTDTDRQHGLGLYNIRETAKLYNGHMTIHYKEGVVRSTTFLCFE